MGSKAHHGVRSVLDAPRDDVLERAAALGPEASGAPGRGEAMR